MLALEFDRAERLLHRVIVWAIARPERAARTSTASARSGRRGAALAAAAFVAAADPLRTSRWCRCSSSPACAACLRSRSCSRSSTRRILPVSVFGRSSTNSISRG